MGVQDLLNLAERQGASLSLAGGCLHVSYPEGGLDAGLRAALKAHKEELINRLAGAATPCTVTPAIAAPDNQDIGVWPGDGSTWEPESPRPFDDSDRAAVLSALEHLRQEHGQAIRRAGWDRQSLWRGMEPESAASWQEVPGILHRLLCGDSIQNVTPQRILLSSGLAWFKSGVWLAGEALRQAEGRAA